MSTRKIETATERCTALLEALRFHAERISVPWDVIFDPLWDGDEAHLTGDDVAQAFVSDASYHKDLPSNLPLAEVMALTVAVAYCVEGMRADLAHDERHAWNVTMEAARLEGFLSGYRTGEAGLPLVEAIRDQLLPMAKQVEQRSEQMADFARKGNKARTLYSEADKAAWRRAVDEDSNLTRLKASSKRGCAASLAKKLGLPPTAVETIRKAI